MTTFPKSVRFQDVDLSIIDRDGTPWLTGPQIVDALGGRDRRMVSNLYQRHRDEFTDAMTTVIRHGRSRVRIFSPRGAHMIAMFARTERAAAFRRWVLDVLEAHAARPALPAPDPAPAFLLDMRRMVVVFEGGRITQMNELDPNTGLVPGDRVRIVRRNLAILRDQLNVLLGEMSVSVLDVPMDEFEQKA